MTPIEITTPFITLGQLLKFINLASSGGEVKALLASAQIFVNDEPENRRGKKCYPGDQIQIDADVWCIMPCR